MGIATFSLAECPPAAQLHVLVQLPGVAMLGVAGPARVEVEPGGLHVTPVVNLQNINTLQGVRPVLANLVRLAAVDHSQLS